MPDDRTTQGGNYWTLFTPGIWKLLHAVLHRKATKLPTREYMAALAEAYCRAEKARDVLVACAGALLCCAPSRSNEMMSLRSDCVVRDVDAQGRQRLSLRWTAASVPRTG